MRTRSGNIIEGCFAPFMRHRRDHDGSMLMNGAILNIDPANAPLYLTHQRDGGIHIGDCLELRETIGGMEGVWRVHDAYAPTILGHVIEELGWRDLSAGLTLDLVNDTTPAMIGGRATVLIRRAEIFEVALCPRGAMPGSGVTRWQWDPRLRLSRSNA